LLYPKKAIEDGLAIAVADNAARWKITPDEGRDWICTITRRIRNLCRVVSQPIIKGKKPTWLSKLTFRQTAAVGKRDGAAEAADEEEDEDEDDSAEEEEKKDENMDEKIDEPLWIISFDRELMLAVRSLIESPSKKEISKPVKDDQSKSAHDMITAEWSDKKPLEVPGMTYGGLRNLLARGGSKTECSLWTAEHKTTHHSLRIAQRMDRFLLLSLYEQKKQRLQVRVDTFGEIPTQATLPADNPVIKKALAFMTVLGQKFADDEVKVEELQNLRNEMLASAGHTLRSKAPVKPPNSLDAAEAPTNEFIAKRPAAATAVAPKTKKNKKNAPASSSALETPLAAATRSETIDTTSEPILEPILDSSVCQPRFYDEMDSPPASMMERWFET
jgi:hypothetical protein